MGCITTVVDCTGRSNSAKHSTVNWILIENGQPVGSSPCTLELNSGKLKINSVRGRFKPPTSACKPTPPNRETILIFLCFLDCESPSTIRQPGIDKYVLKYSAACTNLAMSRRAYCDKLQLLFRRLWMRCISMKPGWQLRFTKLHSSAYQWGCNSVIWAGPLPKCEGIYFWDPLRNWA